MSNGYRPEDYLPLIDAARALGCSRQTIYRLISDDRLDAVQLRDAGWWRVARSSLAKYLQRLRHPNKTKSVKRKK